MILTIIEVITAFIWAIFKLFVCVILTLFAFLLCMAILRVLYDNTFKQYNEQFNIFKKGQTDDESDDVHI